MKTDFEKTLDSSINLKKKLINLESEIDKISISHKAKNREGFALGAVVAAEQIAGKKGVFTMSDIIKF